MSRAPRLALVASVALGACRTPVDCTAIAPAPGTSTAATLQLDLPRAQATWVEHGTGTETAVTTPTGEPSQTPVHTLLGLPAGWTSWFRVYAEGLDTPLCEGSVTTALPPATVPRYEVSVHDAGAVDAPYVLISNAGTADAGPVVVDRDGRVVWYMEKSDELAHTQMEASQGGIAGSGSSGSGPALLYMEQDIHREDGAVSALVGVTWTHEETVRHGAYGAHHAFTQLPDGTVAYLGTDVREWTDPESGEVELVAGDEIVEVSPDGSEATVWSTWDELPVEPHETWDVPYFPDMRDWTHANSVFYDAETDRYLVSLGNVDTVVEVARDTGLITGRFGRHDSTFVGESTIFDFQHGATWTDAGTLLLSTTTYYTFSVEYAVDRDQDTLTQVWSHGYDQGLIAAALGEASRLPDGHTLVSFGMAGLIQEVDAAGQVVWELTARKGVDRLSSPRLFHDFYATTW